MPRINPQLSHFVCSRTGEVLGTDPIGLCRCCPAPGSPVEARYRPSGPATDDAASGLWRYGPLLPVVDVPAHLAADVGRTPVYRLETLSAARDVDVWVKHEGGNPSGSFKDRGLAVAVALAATWGATRLCLPTQGNAGIAAALFSVRMGLEPALVVMPVSHQGSVYHRAAALHGAEVRFAGANIAEAGRWLREEHARALASGALVDVSTFFEPGRLEGKKTMGLEIAEAMRPLPDVVVYPTGGGTGLVGIHKAFEELRARGELTGPTPKMVAVQSERCAPVVDAFVRGDDVVTPVVSRGTVADGLDVPGAIMGHRILAVLRASGGTAVGVSDAAIETAWRTLGAAGLPTGLEGAATLAGLDALRASTEVSPGQRVLLLSTSGPSAALARRGRSDGSPGTPAITPV